MTRDTAPRGGKAQFLHTPSDQSGLLGVHSTLVASSLQDLKYIFRHSAHYNLHSLCQTNVR